MLQGKAVSTRLGVAEGPAYGAMGSSAPEPLTPKPNEAPINIGTKLVASEERDKEFDRPRLRLTLVVLGMAS